MSRLRLALISDVHLAPLPPVPFGAMFGKRATGFLNWHLKRKHEHHMEVLARVIDHIKAQAPDHILFCGDAVNLGLNAEFQRARHFLEQLGSPDRVTAIPGNHDLYVEEAREAMIASFGPWMTGDNESAPQFPFVRRREHASIIGLNSALPTPAFDATGMLGAAQIAATEHLLSMMPATMARIIALHHPATVGGTAKGRDLTDAPALTEMMKGAHADLIVHGHNHYLSLNWMEGARGRIPVLGLMSGSGTNIAFGGIPGWAMATIDHVESGAHVISITAHEYYAPGDMRSRVIL